MKRTRPHKPEAGAVHADLLGADEYLPFRPKRLLTADLNSRLTCRGTVEDSVFGPFPVIDISSTGLAMDLDDSVTFPPGTSIDQLELLFRESVFWQGSATAVYHVDGHTQRAGLRFSSGLLDLHLIRITDSLEARLEQSLLERRTNESILSADWRASVGELRGLLEDIKEVFDNAESSLDAPSDTESGDQLALFDRIFEKWGDDFYSRQENLFRLSEEIEPSNRERAQSYASRELLPLFYPSPMYQRAFEKPLGYAGDYRLIEMYFSDNLTGETLYSQFLQYVAQRYPLGRAVRSRERLMRSRIRETITTTPSSRVVSLACGPAIELKKLLDDFPDLSHTTELVIVDQDEQAMHFAHNGLSRSLLARGSSLSEHVRLNGLHISVKQILRPRDEAEAGVVNSSLQNANLIYAAGLYDYLPETVAAALTKNLYGHLAPGGTLFIGNLKMCPVSTWVMEYVLAWHLQYRTEALMQELAKPFEKLGAKSRVVLDDTGLCVFLEVSKPE